MENFNPRPVKYSNESAEFRGKLEEEYAKHLKKYGAEVVGGFGDGGKDVSVEDFPGVTIFQVKNSWRYAAEFLDLSIRKFKTFIPIAVGDFGKDTPEQILNSIKENGGYVGFDEPQRELHLKLISATRDLILKNGGRIKFE